jgi:DNA-binding GntR family transcriptional regulator
MEDPRHKGNRELRIATDLRRRIESNEWQPGEKMPSTRDLSEQYEGLSLTSLNRIINTLRTWGLVVTRPRQGMFRRPPKPLRTVLPSEPMDFSTVDPVRMTVPAFSWVAEELGVDKDTLVHRTRWVVTVGESVWCLSDVYTLEEFSGEVPSPDAGCDRVRVSLPHVDEAELLVMPPEVPVMILLNTFDGGVVQRMIPGDRVEYRATPLRAWDEQ